MAFKNANTNRAKFDISKTEVTVKNARVLSDTCAVFTLAMPGLSLYNMRVVERADGKRFIAPPQTKGKDNKYYNQYAIYLSPEDEAKLIADVEKLLDE